MVIRTSSYQTNNINILDFYKAPNENQLVQEEIFPDLLLQHNEFNPDGVEDMEVIQGNLIPHEREVEISTCNNDFESFGYQEDLNEQSVALHEHGSEQGSYEQNLEIKHSKEEIGLKSKVFGGAENHTAGLSSGFLYCADYYEATNTFSLVASDNRLNYHGPALVPEEDYPTLDDYVGESDETLADAKSTMSQCLDGLETPKQSILNGSLCVSFFQPLPPHQPPAEKFILKSDELTIEKAENETECHTFNSIPKEVVKEETAIPLQENGMYVDSADTQPLPLKAEKCVKPIPSDNQVVTCSKPRPRKRTTPAAEHEAIVLVKVAKQEFALDLSLNRGQRNRRPPIRYSDEFMNSIIKKVKPISLKCDPDKVVTQQKTSKAMKQSGIFNSDRGKVKSNRSLGTTHGNKTPERSRSANKTLESVAGPSRWMEPCPGASTRPPFSNFKNRKSQASSSRGRGGPLGKWRKVMAELTLAWSKQQIRQKALEQAIERSERAARRSERKMTKQ